MILSKASQYAIRALTYLAVEYPDSLCPLERIAGKEKIPQPFLAKILQRLAHKRLVRSVKGLKGGFALAIPPDQITLYSIVDAMDDLSAADQECILGRSSCSQENSCPLHHFWSRQRECQLDFFKKVTIHDLAGARTLPIQVTT